MKVSLQNTYYKVPSKKNHFSIHYPVAAGVPAYPVNSYFLLCEICC